MNGPNLSIYSSPCQVIKEGDRFGKWIVLKTADARPLLSDGKVASRYWFVRCDCGFESKVRRWTLLNGKTKGCRSCAKRGNTFTRGKLFRGLRKANTVSSSRKGNGYITLTNPPNIPGGPYRRILEHRAIISSQLGRKLYPHENVHHKNGIKNDNSPENLELWSISQPPGQRVEDKLAWCKWFLSQYPQ